MNILKVLWKQLFGAKYERAVRSLVGSLILFLAVHTAGIRMEISPSVFFLAATAISAGIMWQSLHSSGNADRMAGLFMLPFANREMTVSFVLAFTGHTLLTKTFSVMALFLAVHKWSVWQTATALLCAVNGCFMAAAWYTMTREGSGRLLHGKRKRMLLVALWCGSMLLSIFFVQALMGFLLIVLASLFLSFLKLLMTDAYVFYRPVSAKALIRRTGGTGSVLLYLLRYLVTNKNYLLNTAGLCVAGGFLSVILGRLEGMNVMPLGFAILCLNTPVCTLLSSDPGLEQAVRVLPGQAGRFGTRYGLFISLVNMAVSSVYLVSWQILHGGVGGMEILTAALIALQSAILSVLLEWFYPVRSWKIESDLWRHPRKYIVPLIMMLTAGIIGMWAAGIWILFCMIIAEALCLIVSGLRESFRA